MSAVNPLPDSALHALPDLGDSDELPLPTQPWNAPPTFAVDTWGTFEGENEPEFEFDADGTGLGEFEGHAERFDFHDTIPAPPWLDEPGEGLEMPVFPAR
jgi:hypothetical protein